MHPSHLRGWNHLLRARHRCTTLHNRNHHHDYHYHYALPLCTTTLITQETGRDLRVQTLNSAPEARKNDCVWVCVAEEPHPKYRPTGMPAQNGKATSPSGEKEKTPFSCACAARHASKLTPSSSTPALAVPSCPAFAQSAGPGRHFPELCRQLRPIAAPCTPTCPPTGTCPSPPLAFRDLA